MKFVFHLLIFIIPIAISAQMVDFDIENVESENFKNEVEPFIKTVSILSVNHFEDQFKTNKRFQFGVAYSQGLSISGNETSTNLLGGYPNIGGALMISDNLKLKGNFSIFSSGEDIVQSFAYGIGLRIANNEAGNWRLSILFADLKGPSDIELKAMDTNISYGLMIKNLPVYIGVGSNSYKSKILIENDDIPNTIKGNSLYLSLAAQFNKWNFTTTPLIKINLDAIIVGIEFSGAVH
jgi:hypothetical protein